jgi:hypothetical protein
MKVKQIVSDIRNISSSGSNPVEFKIEDQQIIFWCNEVRSTLISQAIQKKQDLSDVWIQAITCLQLEQVDSSECCNITTGCYLLKSVQKIPITIESWMDNTIVKVTKPTGDIIAKSNGFEANYNKFNKYTGKTSNWYLKNGYLYITNEQLLETVNVYGIFENPSDLSNFINCSNNSCFGWDSEYPCSLKMSEMITDIILKTRIYPYLQLPADNKNDGANINEQPNLKGL